MRAASQTKLFLRLSAEQTGVNSFGQHADEEEEAGDEQPDRQVLLCVDNSYIPHVGSGLPLPEPTRRS